MRTQSISVRNEGLGDKYTLLFRFSSVHEGTRKKDPCDCVLTGITPVALPVLGVGLSRLVLCESGSPDGGGVGDGRDSRSELCKLGGCSGSRLNDELDGAGLGVPLRASSGRAGLSVSL